ncbi:MAG TPA: heme exporter protein CcmB [Burkholderiales bacterium]|nr:heme exporter protein CcmB [Burkholderiales bacterium]
MLSVMRGIIGRDLTLAWRRRSDVLTTLLFFVIVASLFPLGIGPEPQLLRAIGPGVVWVAALLASMLALSRLFAGDYADGTLEQMLLAATPLSVIVIAKVIAHWFAANLPLVLIAPLLGLQFGLSGDALAVLALALALGTPSLSLIGAIGAALTLGLRGGGVLLALLVLPLYAPVLILGALAVEATAAGLSAQPYLLLLAALSLAALSLAPWAIAAALRISYE